MNTDFWDDVNFAVDLYLQDNCNDDGKKKRPSCVVVSDQDFPRRTPDCQNAHGIVAHHRYFPDDDPRALLEAQALEGMPSEEPSEGRYYPMRVWAYSIRAGSFFIY